MLINQTLEKMRAMKLHHMARSIEERIARTDHQDLSVQEILGLIVDDEFTARENAKLEGLLRGAKFKEKQACVENIDYKTSRGFKKQTMLELAQLKRFENAHVLILDDLGISELRENERRDLLEVVEDRYGVGSTIVTSQLAIKDWHQYFGGGRPADSICDRLNHNCHRIEILPTADSQRKLRSSVDLQNLK